MEARASFVLLKGLVHPLPILLTVRAVEAAMEDRVVCLIKAGRPRALSVVERPARRRGMWDVPRAHGHAGGGRRERNKKLSNY